MLNVLSITAGEKLLETLPCNKLNRFQLRQIEYAKLVSRYHIITRTIGKHKFSTKTIPPNITIYPTNSKNRLYFIKDAYRIAKKICSENPIHLISCRDPFLFGLVGYFIKRKYKIPLNIHIMADMIDNKYFIRERWYNFLFNILGRWVIRKADTVRVSTVQEKEKIVGKFARAKVYHIPFFVDFSPFLKNSNKKVRKKLLKNQTDKIILFVGRLTKQKDLPTLIKAIHLISLKHKDFILFIVGADGQKRRVEKLIKKYTLADYVLLIGEVSYSEIPSYFAVADIFAITSTYEGTCMVLLEAAAAAKPVVATNFSGAHDAIVDGETGFIVSIKNYKKVALKITELIENPDKAKKMGMNARKYVLELFDKEDILRKYGMMWNETYRKFSVSKK